MIGFNMRGQEDVNKFLKSLPHGTMRVAVAAFTEYILGNNNHGLKYNPPQKKVTRIQAYGESFVSDKQRRWFFANLNDGTLDIPSARTGKLSEGWKIYGSDYQKKIVNKVPYSPYVQGFTQSRMSKLGGWHPWPEVITSNMKGAMQAARQAVNRWLKTRGK